MYGLVLFICGFSVMVLELAGVRIISPFLGSSHIVYTSIIGIIMASLSFGYWLGGKLSGKNISELKLSMFIFFAGIYILLLALFQFGFLRYIVTLNSVSLILKSVICSLVMFFVPSVLLGMVSPYTVQLSLNKLKNDENTGSVVGRYYAISTIGSILGTFLCGFYLIIKFGIGTIFMALSSALFLSSVLALSIYLKDKKKIKLILFFVYMVAFFISCFTVFYFKENPLKIKQYLNSKLLFHKTTAYNTINVIETTSSNGIKFILVDNFFTAVYKDKAPDENAFGYIKWFYEFFKIKEKKNNVLILGNATGSLLASVLYTCEKEELQNINIDVVEIDKDLTEIGEKYFKLPKDDKRVSYFYEDARTFLNRETNKKYDLIYYDIFSDVTLIFPYHLITKETFDRINSMLDDDGIFFLNIIANMNKTGKNYSYLRQMYTQIKNSFKHVNVYKTQCSLTDENVTQNMVIMGYKDINNKDVSNIKNSIQNYEMDDVEETSEIYTDYFSPVEKFI